MRIDAIDSIRRRRLTGAVAGITLCMATPVGVADIAGDMTAFYDSLGGTASASGPQLYRGQSAGYFSAGSFNARAPIRNYNPVSVQMPSIRAGCGGIDLFLGGFSYINANELITMLQNIGSGAVGYAFQLALATISPTINGVLSDMRSMADKVNSMNVNTCQAGMEMVKGAVMLSGAQKSVCEQLSFDSGQATDYAQARFMCQDQTHANNILRMANAGALASTSGSNPAKTTEAIAGNVVWRGLMKDPALAGDTQMARLLMSMTGTLVLYLPPMGGGATDEPVPRVPLVDYRRLVTAVTPDASEVYTCTDGEAANQCLHLGIETRDLGILRQKVVADLSSLIAKVTADTGGSAAMTVAEQFILTRTGLPVLRLIQTVADVDPSLVADVVRPYTNAIVADVAYGYFRAALTAVEPAVQQSGTGQDGQRQALVERIRSLLAEAQRDRSAQLKLAGGMEEFINKVNLYQKVLASSMSPSLQQRLAFARALERR